MALIKRTVIGANADKKSAILYHDSPKPAGYPERRPLGARTISLQLTPSMSGI
jgi:hypothetical protein